MKRTLSGLDESNEPIKTDMIRALWPKRKYRKVFVRPEKNRIPDDLAFCLFSLVIMLFAIVIVMSVVFSHQINFIQGNLEEHLLADTAISPTPTVEATPEITPGITPTTVTIQLAPIVDRRIFKITAFCACKICCKKTDGITFSGVHVQEGVTCAADLSVLPLGTVVDIEGIGLRTVQDKGSKVKGDHLDIFVNDHKLALAFGVQYRMVTIFEKEGK